MAAQTSYCLFLLLLVVHTSQQEDGVITTTATQTITPSTLSCQRTNTAVLLLIFTVIIAVLLATVIVTLHIPLYVRYRRLLTSTKVSKETAAPAVYEEATYEQIDETKHGAFLELRQNEAYGTARVTG